MKKSSAERSICPFIQTMESQLKSVPSPKVHDNLPANITCIGGACMAWQNTDVGGNDVDARSDYGYCKLIDGKKV